MAEIKATKILTEQEFNSSPYKNLMSYQDYFNQALKLGSAFTFQRALALNKLQEKSEEMSNEITGWCLEREIRKNEAEEKYYASLAQYNKMKNAERVALSDLKYATKMYGENSTHYNEAFKKYNLSAKTLFQADIDLSCARDQFSFANKSTYNALLTSQTLS